MSNDENKIKEHNVVIMCLHSYRHYQKQDLDVTTIESIKDLNGFMQYLEYFSDDAYVKGAYATFHIYDKKSDDYILTTKSYEPSLQNVMWFEDFEKDAKEILYDEQKSSDSTDKKNID